MKEDENIEVDSINWGSASKGTAKKVYGNALKAPEELGRKIMILREAEKLALGEIDFDTYTVNIKPWKV